MDTRDRFRILSLDGGGVWAVIEMRALMRLFGEEARGRDVLGHFDLVAANSAGSVMVAAMIEDYTLSRVLGLLLDEPTRASIFVYRSLLAKVVPHDWFIGPRWSTAEKRIGLSAQLPTMGDVPIDRLPEVIGGRRPALLFVAFDYDRERAVFFRSNRGSRAANSSPYTPPSLLLAALASSDAPVRYFDAPVEIGPAPARRYWDGGVGGYNNPVLAAVTEALANGIAPDRMDVLSIGTGSTHRPLESAVVSPPLAMPREEPGIVHDFKKLAAAILDEPPDAASFIAHVALGQAMPADAGHPVADGSLVRMNPVATPVLVGGEWMLPRATHIRDSRFARLVGLDMDVVAQEDVALIDEFAREWLADIWPNQPIRGNADGACEIGQPTFGAALAAWRTRMGPGARQPSAPPG